MKRILAGPVAEAAAAALAGEEPQAGRDLGRVEELARQRHHAVHQARLDQAFPDLALARLARRHRAVGEHEAGHAPRRQVMDDVLHPGEVGVALGRRTVAPALVVGEPLAAPVGDVEGWVGQDEIGPEVGVAVVVEAVAVGDLALDAADGEVHLRDPPGRVVRLLSPDRDVAARLAAVAVARGVGVDEGDRLHEHAGRAATGVVDPAAIGLEHLDQQLDDAAGRVELATLLALGARELRQEVLVDAAEHVLGAGILVAHHDVADHVDELAETLLVQRRPGVVLGQHVLEHRVVALDTGHRAVDELADGGLARLGLEMAPTGFRRHPKDVLGPVLVRVLRVGALVLLRDEAGMPLLEGVGNVLEEDQPEDDMLVLGRVHRAAQGVGHLPELGLIARRGTAGRPRRRILPLLPRSSPRHAPPHPRPSRHPPKPHRSRTAQSGLDPQPNKGNTTSRPRR